MQPTPLGWGADHHQPDQPATNYGRKPEGGWYDTLALDNSSGRDVTLYQAQVPVKVSIRNESDFSVTLVNPLILTHSTNPR